jgi:hypothetical protein
MSIFSSGCGVISRMPKDMKKLFRIGCCLLLVLTAFTHDVQSQEGGGASSPSGKPAPKPEFPPYNEVFEGYEQVISTIDKSPTLFGLFVNRKDNQILAAFPKKYQSKKFFIALTVASGELYAGLQQADMYVYWKQIGKRMVLIQPNVEVRSTGDSESRSSVERLFTDRVLADIPIVTMHPQWGPVVDLDGFLLGEGASFFGSSARGLKRQLAVIKNAKAFPENIEIAFEVPVSSGLLKTFHYSISEIKPNPSYRPRKADERVGYFTTGYDDLGKFQQDDVRTRFINRWHLEKAAPELKTSPVKNPIVFYVEHTTPIRYRRWVREGVMMWNKAFEEIGLLNAIEVRYQDQSTNAHMEYDPEDVRYNFIRWLNNNVGTAIGPSRANPITGEILDADIILTDGWIRHFWRKFNEELPKLAMEGYSPETLAWLQKHPEWDPRVRLAHPSNRETVAEEIAHHSHQSYGGHPLAHSDPSMIGDDEFDGLVGRTSQVNGFCQAADFRALDMAVMRFAFELMSQSENETGEGAEGTDPADDKKDSEEPKKEEDLLDGIPDWFVGPLIADLVAHEVGHTLGLRHNFKASSIYSLEEINSSEVKGKKPFAGSVMDYLPVNMNIEGFGEEQGDYGMIEVGPYDLWAIEYGYSIVKKDDELKKVLARVNDPLLAYATDEDTYGPDPYARRYDFAQDPISYAKSQMKLANDHRKNILDKFVKDGDSWAKARYGYGLTLSIQMRSLSMMANWLGGAQINRAKKGDPDSTAPIQVVDASKQREALRFVMKNAFYDKAFGLTPELLRHMSMDKWIDDFSSAIQDSTWPIHDRIMGIQSSALTMLMNPTTMGRVYDNEFLTPEDEDMITLPEILGEIREAIWTELEDPEEGKFTARRPMISSLRRNLQREHLERLIDLSMGQSFSSVSYKPISNLATAQLRDLKKQIDLVLSDKELNADPYSAAHLSEASVRIEKALDAGFIYNTSDIGGGGASVRLILGDELKRSAN